MLIGLAERRQDRSPPAVQCDTGQALSSKWVVVTADNFGSTQRTEQVQTDDERRKEQQLRQQLKEKGNSCMRCCLAGKKCDREDICWKCRLPQPGLSPRGEASFCFRNIEQLWLWRAIVQPSLDRGSRIEALDKARNTTFADCFRQSMDLPPLGQDSCGSSILLVLYLTSKLGDSSATSRIVVRSDSLTTSLRSMPASLTKKIKAALALHIPNAVLPSLQYGLSVEERSILTLAQSASRIYHFLSNAAFVKYHASTRNTNSAREVTCFLIQFCARLLAIEVENLLVSIRAMVRKYKKPGNVTKHAFGLYYGILTGLQQWNTHSALDLVLTPLTSRASEVIDALGLLYRNIYGLGETLLDFVTREIPVMPELRNLHISHELPSAIDDAVTTWNPLVYDPFQKAFSLLLRELLVLDGKVDWPSHIHHVRQGVLSHRDNDFAFMIPVPQAGSEASLSSQSPPVYESPDATLLNPSSDERSTFIQSPTEAEHGAEPRYEIQAQIGDVRMPQDLLGITGDTGHHPKRARSPQSFSPSPPSKRPVLDAWQLRLDRSQSRFFDEEYESTMQGRATPGS